MMSMQSKELMMRSYRGKTTPEVTYLLQCITVLIAYQQMGIQAGCTPHQHQWHPRCCHTLCPTLLLSSIPLCPLYCSVLHSASLLPLHCSSLYNIYGYVVKTIANTSCITCMHIQECVTRVTHSVNNSLPGHLIPASS